MSIAGLVGGLGPESTIEYYRQIVQQWQVRTGDGSYPSMVLTSMNVAAMIDLVTASRFDRVADLLVLEVKRLAAAGASFAAITANTPHVVFNEVRAASPLPLISIVEAARDEMMRLGISRAALLGTRFTMNGRFYPDVCEAAGITIVVPREEEQAYIHEKYISELIPGRIVPVTRDGVLAIVRRLAAEEHVQGVILGGTELPLILKQEDAEGIMLLDTTAIHVDRIVTALLEKAA